MNSTLPQRWVLPDPLLACDGLGVGFGFLFGSPSLDRVFLFTFVIFTRLRFYIYFFVASWVSLFFASLAKVLFFYFLFRLVSLVMRKESYLRTVENIRYWANIFNYFRYAAPSVPLNRKERLCRMPCVH